MLDLIESMLRISNNLEDKISCVNLYELQIKQLFHSSENLSLIEELLSTMKLLAKRENYQNGLALSSSIEWGVEKLKGNKELAFKAVNSSINLLEKSKLQDDYIYYVCQYSWAIERWLEKHDANVINILEGCILYFYKKGFHRGLIQTLGILSIIYLRTQDKKKAIEISKKLFINRYLFDQQPKDVQAMAYYFAAVGQLLTHNLKLAEKLLDNAYILFKRILKQSNCYSYYYPRLLSHIALNQAMQGKLEESIEKINKIEELLGDRYIIKNMDKYSRKQVPHTLNLIKFYVYSRIFGFNHNAVQILIEKIYIGIKDNYSDSIMLGEFLLNAELSYEQLNELKEIDNASLKRIGNIIDYVIEKTKRKETTIEEQYNSYISALKNKPTIKDLSFTENAFSDLLIAQELYSLNRFVDIYQLLEKYENNIDRIDILEMRIFIEAFIQVGKFKNGDPLAPVLHFVAIKRCRERKFGRLEGILLNQQETLQKIALNALNY